MPHTNFETFLWVGYSKPVECRQGELNIRIASVPRARYHSEASPPRRGISRQISQTSEPPHNNPTGHKTLDTACQKFAFKLKSITLKSSQETGYDSPELDEMMGFVLIMSHDEAEKSASIFVMCGKRQSVAYIPRLFLGDIRFTSFSFIFHIPGRAKFYDQNFIFSQGGNAIYPPQPKP